MKLSGARLQAKCSHETEEMRVIKKGLIYSGIPCSICFRP